MRVGGGDGSPSERVNKVADGKQHTPENNTRKIHVVEGPRARRHGATEGMRNFFALAWTSSDSNIR